MDAIVKKIKLFFHPVIVFSAFLLLISACSRQIETGQDKILVAASIEPVTDFVRQVGGDYVEVFTVIPPNTDPHTFELKPELLVKISESRMLVINGIGLEYWADKIKASVNRKDFMLVDTSLGVTIIEESDLEHGDDEAVHHPLGNPHIWLNPQNAIIQVNNIKDALILADSVHAQVYRANAEQYIKLLQEVDAEFSREISSWKVKKFVCYHPAWEYFSRHYGLVQAAVIQKSPGFEPGPREVADIIETIKELQVKAIFTEAQIPDRLTQSIAQEGKISVISLDPIGSYIHIANYIDMMKYNIRQMAGAMKE
ncbi:MAG TPA: metal ABC transporter substrate-binding protein [bacterium]|nr:metal ABC transporter substrate-binding protein [bacterium]HPN43065.1 metal ABC transporter substrate-binding protein [bacterium]